MNSDPYVYPGTTVLKNRREIRDPALLARFEARSTARRLLELQEAPASGSFDSEHLKAIHRHIFQDLYGWAGQFRTVNIATAGQFYFAFAHQIQPSLDELLGRLRDEHQLGSLDQDAFSQRAGYYLAELNAIHPFRDGNGRTQREFIRSLALRNGCDLQWSRVTPEQMRHASHRSFQFGDHSEMASLVRVALRTL